MKKAICGLLSECYRRGLLASQAYYAKGSSNIRRVKARVISVGNITWGGTGKTPLVIKLAKDLSNYYRKKVAVLTRGYGKDEVALLRRKLTHIPVLVGRDRIKTASEAVDKYGAEIILLDDGFQHIRLHRDVDIVTINSTSPFGNGALIPAGNLREPIDHLARAQIFILTKSDIGSKNIHWIRQKLMTIKSDAIIFESTHRPMRLMNYLNNQPIAPREIRGRRVGAISGIADPHSFEKTVENLGAQILFAGRYDDHYAYKLSDLVEFVRRCRKAGASAAITTEKDFMRIAPLLKGRKHRELHQFPFLVLQIEVQIHDEEALLRYCAGTETQPQRTEEPKAT